VKDVNLLELDALRAELREVLTILAPENPTTSEERDMARSLRAMTLRLDKLVKGYEEPKVSPKNKAHGRALYQAIHVAANALTEWGVSDKGALTYVELAEELQHDVTALLALRDGLRERVVQAKAEDHHLENWRTKAEECFAEIQARALAALDAKIDLGKGATFNPKTAEKLRRDLSNAVYSLGHCCDWPESQDVAKRIHEAANRADILALHAIRDEVLTIAPKLTVQPDRSYGFDVERYIGHLRPKAKKTTVASEGNVATSEGVSAE
jgi:hypothetical protein